MKFLAFAIKPDAQNDEKPRDSVPGTGSFSRRCETLPLNSLDALRDGTPIPEKAR
ncbi:MAG: hypothetical protein IPK89_03070 [Sphingomonadales bacterium]|nr:hypothetical protein [Sphingomonadales bacterium]